MPMSKNDVPMQCMRLWLPRRGNSADEYEDASACAPEHGRYAIADGASGSSFAGLWARLLVEGFVQVPASQSDAWSAWLPPLQERWSTEVSSRPLPWFAQNKVQQGAFATFVGLSLRRIGWWGQRWRWRAVAVGDACFFLVRDGMLQQALPVVRAQDFGNTPWLLGSRGATGPTLAEKEVRAHGELRPSDRLWLMTDALAQWFLQEIEAEREPWEVLEPVLAAPRPQEAFARFVDELRDAGTLHNDDVTLVAIGPR
jgi:hypothetical protein